MKLKERSSGINLLTQHYRDYNPSHVLVHEGNSGPYVMPPVTWESISYDVGKSRMNPCTHIKGNYTIHLEGTHQLDYSSGAFSLISGFGPNWLMYPNYIPDAPSPKLGVDQFVLRGFQATRPKFSAKTSVPNFLYELKDLKHAVTSLYKACKSSDFITSLANPYTRKARRIINRHKTRLAKGVAIGDALADEVAGQYLAAKFGYLPLIDDLFNIVDAVQNFNSKLDEFLANGKKLQSGHYTERVARSLGPEIDDPQSSYLREFHQIELGETVYHFTWYYGYTVTQPKLYLPSVFLKFMGFRGNPRILWDAIPFSFLVDWVLRFGKVLESFDQGAIPVTIKVTDACISSSFSGICRHYYADKSGSNPSWNFGPRLLFASEGFDIFRRWPLDVGSELFSGMPPLPVFDKISITEFTLGVALGKTLTSRAH